MTKSRAFATKSGQNISSSVGVTKSRALSRDLRKCQICMLDWTILGKKILVLCRFKKVSNLYAGLDNSW